MTKEECNSVLTTTSARWSKQHKPPIRHPASLQRVCRTVTVSGRRTRMVLELKFWNELRAIAAREGLMLNELCTTIDERRGTLGLAAAVRLYVVWYFRSAAPTTQPWPLLPKGAGVSPLLHAALADIG